jgi:N-formylglutamate amidohydrolase
MILHIPHASPVIPSKVLRTFRISPEELQRELIRLTDAFTDELFARALPSTRAIIHPVSRFVVDPERFADDDQEPMAKKGMGAVYTHTTQGERLRLDLSSEERIRLLAAYYLPHHEALTNAVSDVLEKSATCLILDCHSFPSLPLPCDIDQTPQRPDICIGTDPFHTPEWLADILIRLFQDRGYSVEENRPYCGTIVPTKFYGINKNVMSVMIELNRRLYLDEATGRKSDNYLVLNERLTQVLRTFEAKIRKQ